MGNALPTTDTMRRNQRILAPLLAALVALPLCLTACGTKDAQELTSEGMTAMNSGDAQGALTAFDGALQLMTVTDPQYMRAAVGRCQALARVDPAKGKNDFLALAKANAKVIKDQDFHVVVSEYVRARKFVDAIAIMHEGNQMFAGSKKMEDITKAVVAESQKAQDDDAIAALKNLGYLSSK